MFVDGVRCAIRKDSLWVARGKWAGGVCGGDLVCRCLGKGGGSVAREEKKCLYSKKIFANFVETSCVRQYGPGGIGGKDLCRPDISFLGGKDFF